MNIYRKYNVNEDFFQDWSYDMAYVLGFVASDGYVAKIKRNGGMLSFGLAIKDLNHLLKIRELLCSNHPIREKTDKKGHKSVRLDIGSIKIVNRLYELGIGNNKSLTLEYPQVLAKYANCFVRGYFDGDGYIRIMRYKDANISSLP